MTMMNVIVMFSGKKLDICYDEDSFDSLAHAVATTTNVPVGNQKLIYKGKSLQAGSLSGQGLTPGCKVMLIGSREEVTKKEEFVVLDAVDKEVQAMETRLDELNAEYTGFSKGFTPENMQQQVAQSLSRRLLSFNERGERNLAHLDGLALGAEASRARDRRKDLAERLQALLNISDSLLQDLLQLAADAGYELD